MTEAMNEIELASDLLKIKQLMRDLGQLSYSAKKLEQRFPEIEFSPKEDMKTYIRTNIAFKFDIERLLDELNILYKKYKNESK